MKKKSTLAFFCFCASMAMAQITDATKVIRVVSEQRGPLMYAPTISTKISSGMHSSASVEVGRSRINENDVNQHFVFVPSKLNSGQYYVYSLGANKVLARPSGVEIPLTTLSSTDLENNAGLFTMQATRNTSFPNTYFLNDSGIRINFSNYNSTSGIRCTNDADPDAGNCLKVIQMETAVSTEKLNEIETAVYSYECTKAQTLWNSWNTQMGTGLNTYTAPNNWTTINTNLTNASTNEERKTAITNAVTAFTALRRNLPTHGQFFRIRSTSGSNTRYVRSTLSNNTLTITNDANEAATIFYIGSDGKVISYVEGKHVCNNNANNDGTHGLAAYGAAGNAVIEAANNTTNYNLKVGNNYTFVYNNRPTGSVTNEAGKNDGGCQFLLDEVTSLPITIGTAGYSTFFAPVAVTLPEDGTVKAYTARVEGTELKLSLISGNKIPANTGVILQKDNGGATTLTILKGDNTEALSGALVGHSVSTAQTPNKTTFMLKRNADYLIVLNNGQFKRPLRAYVEVDAQTGVQGLNFSFDVVSAIENALMEANDAPVYDLSGRRIMQRVSGGVYLQNGKKFVQP